MCRLHGSVGGWFSPLRAGASAEATFFRAPHCFAAVNGSGGGRSGYSDAVFCKQKPYSLVFGPVFRCPR